MRTYRVTVVGQFKSLTPQVRETLKREAAEHDMFTADFTPAGTFLYSAALTRFTVRYLLTSAEAAPADADLDVVMRAEAMAQDMLAARGVTHSDLSSTFVCLDDVKVRTR